VIDKVLNPVRSLLEGASEAKSIVDALLAAALLALPHVAGPLPDSSVFIPDGAHLPPVVERELLDFQVLGHALRRVLRSQAIQQVIGCTRSLAILVPGGDQRASEPVRGLQTQRGVAERSSGALDIFRDVTGLADSKPGRHHA